IVNGGGEIAVEDLEAVVSSLVEGMLYVLDRHVARGDAIDRLPQFRGEDFLGGIHRLFCNHVRRDLSIRIEQAARLQHRSLGIAQSAVDGGNTLVLYSGCV